jgi:hypothetical protein
MSQNNYYYRCCCGAELKIKSNCWHGSIRDDENKKAIIEFKAEHKNCIKEIKIKIQQKTIEEDDE